MSAKKNRLLHFFLLLVSLFLLTVILPTTAQAANVVNSGEYEDTVWGVVAPWVLTDDGVFTVHGTDNTGIRAISCPRYKEIRDLIQVVILDENVRAIDRCAFSTDVTLGTKYCESLVAVLAMNGLERIDYEAFAYCPVKTLYLPETITEVGYDAFDRNPALSDIYYGGTEEQWDAIYNGSSIPNSTNPFWYYDAHPTIHYNARYVLYNDNGGSGAPFFQGFVPGERGGLQLSSQVPTREGYVFTGWNTEPDGSGTACQPGESYQFDDSVTLYAQWFGDAPSADAAEGTVAPGTKVALRCPTHDAVIHYTTDGKAPTASSPVYEKPIKISKNMTLKAIAVWDGHSSAVGSYDYTIVDGKQPLIYAGKARCVPGNRAVVPIYLANNPGIASLRISIAYDSEAMTIENAEDCELLKGTSFNTDDLMQEPFYLYWENDNATENDTASGQIAAVTFSVYPDTKPGYYPITVSLSAKDAMDCDWKPVSFTTVSALLHVDAAYLGDVDGNGFLEAADRMQLMRYLANWDGYAEGTDLMAADVNRDTEVNPLDGGILVRHLAQWKNYKILPCDPTGEAGNASLSSQPEITVSAPAKAKAGDDVDVTLSLAGNPGVAMMRLYVDYDNHALTLKEVKDHDLLGKNTALHGTGDNLLHCPYTLLWNNSNAAAEKISKADGDLVTLTFHVNETIAEETEVPIRVSYDAEQHDIVDANLSDVAIDTTPATITVSPLTGDNAWYDGLSYTKTKDTVTVYGKAPQKAVIYCASYDSGGRMIAVKKVSTGVGYKLPAGTASAKLFLLDRNTKPLCEAVKL